MAMEGAFLQCSRAPLSSTATRSLNTTCSLKFSWSSSVSKFLNNFDGKCDALGTTGVRYCIGAKGRLRNEDTVKPRKPKSPKLHRTWTPGWTAPPRRELGNFDAVDRIDLNRNPTTTQGDVESSKPVVDYERQSRGDLSKTALQCEHFQKCSGCTHEWRLDQPLVLEEAKKFFNDHGVHDFTFTSGSLWEWRCRAKLAVRGTSDNLQIGLYQEGTHNVVDIPFCRAHHPNINSVIELLKEAIRNLNVIPYDEVSCRGDLRYVQMAVTTYDTSLPLAERYSNGKVQVALVWNSRNESSSNTEKLSSLSEFLWRRGGSNSDTHIIHSVWANFQTSHSNIIFGARWRHLIGEREFWERIGGVDICLEPGSFGQANTQAPIHWLEGSDVVVVDPPRKGLDASLIDALCTSSFRGQKAVGVSHRVEKRPWIVRAQQPSVHTQSKTNWDANASWPETLIYVSCGWESFKQDCSALLSNKAWHLENAHAFNLFPGTDSVEILAIFKRGERMKQKKRKSSKRTFSRRKGT